MKISNFFIIRSIFIPIILLGSIAVASIFTHLQVKQQENQFEAVFRTQNVKALAESDIFTLSNNLGQLIGKFNFKCLSAKNNDVIFLQKGSASCSPNIFEAAGQLVSSSKKIHIKYVLQLPSSWYYLSVGLILIQAILAITLLLLSNYFEKRILQQDKVKAQALLNQAKQVAHDIRSPLAVINSNSVDESTFKLAIERLNDIATNLLGQSKDKRKTLEIKEIANQILLEKRFEFPHVEFNISSCDKTVHTDAVLASRILSNLLNNAAYVSSSVKIEITKNSISVIDQGPGIPEHILKSLENNIGSTTKTDGNGIGLLHAKQECLNINAALNIKTSSFGTNITITWKEPTKKSAILLEDDLLISKMWKIEADRNNIDLKTFSSSNDFFIHLEHCPKNIYIFIDENISENEKGSKIAYQLSSQGFYNLYLCTGYDAKEFKHTKGYINAILGKDYPRDILA